MLHVFFFSAIRIRLKLIISYPIVKHDVQELCDTNTVKKSKTKYCR